MKASFQFHLLFQANRAVEVAQTAHFCCNHIQNSGLAVTILTIILEVPSLNLS
jgi:hypothetical protein